MQVSFLRNFEDIVANSTMFTLDWINVAHFGPQVYLLISFSEILHEV